MKILQYPHSALSTVCAVVEDFKLARKVASDLREAMKTTARKGMGLAANQLGHCHRIFLLDTKYLKLTCPSIFVNPEISDLSSLEDVVNEGCLSLSAAVSIPVRRIIHVEVKAYDEHGDQFIVELTGMAARCAQHEADHLRGKTILDLASKKEKRKAMQQIVAAIKKKKG